MELIQRPKPDNKFLTVADLLELADACRSQDIDPKRIVCAEGVVSMGGAMRGLRIKEKRNS